MTGFGFITLLIALIPGSATIGGCLDRPADRACASSTASFSAAPTPRPCRWPWNGHRRIAAGCGRTPVVGVPGRVRDAGHSQFRSAAIDVVRRRGLGLRAVGMADPIRHRRAARRSAQSSSTGVRRSNRPPSAPELGDRRPLGELLFGRFRRDLLQVLILMTGVWLANNMVSAVMPQLLAAIWSSPAPRCCDQRDQFVRPRIAFQVYGALSQRTGRRRFYLWYGAVMAVIGSSLYALLMTSDAGRSRPPS